MKTKLILGLFMALALALTNCSDDQNDSNSDETGRLVVRLTDAPFPHDLVAEANVTIFKVDARLVDDGNDDDETSEENEGNNGDSDDNSPFVVLMEEEIDVNLLELTNGVTEQLANLDVPAGTYDLVRVYVRGINVVLTDERVFDLKVPSGEQTGIKVFIKPALNVIGGLSSDLLLDFDVSRSFVAKGSTKRVDGITGFNFKPVIKASNMSTAGTLAGTVITIEEEMEMALEGAQITVLAADTVNTTGFTDTDGNYAIMGLESGAYKAFAELEGFVKSDTVEVMINAANVTPQDFVLEVEESTEEEGS